MDRDNIVYTIEDNIVDTIERGGKAPKAPPTYEEVVAYIREHHPGVSPDKFYGYYEARGWHLSGGQKVKNWKALVRNWAAREGDYNLKRQGKGAAHPEQERFDELADTHRRSDLKALIDRWQSQEPEGQPQDNRMTALRAAKEAYAEAMREGTDDEYREFWPLVYPNGPYRPGARAATPEEAAKMKEQNDRYFQELLKMNGRA